MNEWQRVGVSREELGSWGARVSLVSKKNGDPRVCIAYIILNANTIPVTHRVPLFSQLQKFVAGATYLSTIDLCWAYQHIPIRKTDIPKTGFVTETAHYVLTRMIFGFKNAPSHFQYVMETLLKECKDIAFVYVDDIIIIGSTIEEHTRNVRRVLQVLAKAGFKVRLTKCEFFKKWVKYLGRLVSGDGVRMDPEYKEMVLKWRRPANVDELRSFVGCVSWLRMFMPNFVGPAFWHVAQDDAVRVDRVTRHVLCEDSSTSGGGIDIERAARRLV
jgi:hypothetical protein